MERKDKYLITCFGLIFITILGALLSLNRLANSPSVVFDFNFRILLEHFLTGFYFPLIILCFAYLGFILVFLLSFKRFTWPSKLRNLSILLLGTIIIISFEIWWQFGMSYNFQSFEQMIYLFFGNLVLWIYVIKIKLFD